MSAITSTETTPQVVVEPAPPKKKWRFKLPPSPPVPRWSGWIAVIAGLAILTVQLGKYGLDFRRDAFAWIQFGSNSKSLGEAATNRGMVQLKTTLNRTQSIIDYSADVAHEHPNWSTYRQTFHGMVRADDNIDEQRKTKAIDVPDAAPWG